MRRFVAVLAVALTAVACSSAKGGSGNSDSTDAGDGGDAVQLMAGFDPGPAPDPSQGFQIITPAVTDIEPGASDEYCTYTNITLQQDTWVNAAQGFQTEGGHHVIIYYGTDPQPVGTGLCSNSAMAEFNFGIPASSNGMKFALPGNLAIKLPKGAQIVVNHHYLNAGATPIAEAQSAINLFYADPSVAHTTSSSMIVLDTTLEVPVGASSYTIDCTVNQTYEAWMQFPHMHNWGTHITVTDTPVATGVPQQLVNLDWDPSYSFDPTPIATTEDPSKPFTFNAGDKIHVECDYLNNTGSAMSFGDEMCVFGAFTVDTNNYGNLDCDKGQWGPF
jgi:hypothetical protein